MSPSKLAYFSMLDISHESEIPMQPSLKENIDNAQTTSIGPKTKLT